eukprot:SAG11_NODE_8957_length_959_cov_1.022093_2_plen_168_part_00
MKMFHGLTLMRTFVALMAALGQQQDDSFVDDVVFGQQGDGAADYPPFDADFPEVPTKNCSTCGGRDGCAGCLCVKKCKPAQVNESLPFISRTLGSHMVLQRAPASAMVYGHAKLGSTVTTTFGGKNYTTFASSVGDRATLTDVLFGEVYFCSGPFGYLVAPAPTIPT